MTTVGYARDPSTLSQVHLNLIGGATSYVMISFKAFFVKLTLELAEYTNTTSEVFNSLTISSARPAI